MGFVQYVRFKDGTTVEVHEWDMLGHNGLFEQEKDDAPRIKGHNTYSLQTRHGYINIRDKRIESLTTGPLHKPTFRDYDDVDRWDVQFLSLIHI